MFELLGWWLFSGVKFAMAPIGIIAFDYSYWEIIITTIFILPLTEYIHIFQGVQTLS